MIRELSELGKKLRSEKSKKKIVHDALKEEPISIDLIINEDGSFVRFEAIEKIMTTAEAITAKKGKARLLIDKPEEVINYGNEIKKHELFIKKIEEYNHLKEIKPVIRFYKDNKNNGLDKAINMFEEQIGEKERKGNIAFRVATKAKRIHEEESVITEIIRKYEDSQLSKLEGDSKKCSICGKADYPVEDIPHGMIKKVPDGQPTGCALVSYNEKAFESYGLIGNNNSSICTNCSRTYVEGFNWLLSNGSNVVVSDNNKKQKEIFKYTNRKNFGSDTAMVFWTRNNKPVSEIALLDSPDTADVAKLIDSITSGDNKTSRYLDEDQFYSCTLSGSAARIAVRDWFELSLNDFKKSIALWFKDIAIERYNFELKKCDIYYSRLYELASCARNEKEQKDTTSSRIAVHLWNAALKGSSPPIWILNAVIKRVRIMENDENNKSKESITPARAALIRLILNRNNKGGIMIQETLDKTNLSPAYVCGRIFAVLESIQRAAMGNNINAGIRERFFSFAATNPSSAFGRLMKLSQNHITKLKGEKPGLAIVLDKDLQDLFSMLNEFPAIFSLEEQGQFAIGYYHQKQFIFTKAKDKPEMRDALDESASEK